MNLFTFEVLSPPGFWDTFAEPNNYTIPSKALGQNQASSAFGGPRPKSRITVEGCGQRATQNLSFWGSEIPLKIRWVFFMLKIVWEILRSFE